MERLTIPDEKIEGGVRRTVIDARKVKENAMRIYWALKKYEDTGLTPEQIQELKERDTAKAPKIHKNKHSNAYTCPNCNLVLINKDETGWFRGECQFKPQDKQLCVVIPNIGSKFPMICQWRWGAHNHVRIDAFCDISERIYHERIGIIEEDFIPDYLGMRNVDRWKPLGLPADVEERVLAEVEKWFEEEGGIE